MKWSSRYFSNYIRWQFEFNHREYPIYLVIKLVGSRSRLCYIATWKTDRMRGSQFEITQPLIPSAGNPVLLNARRKLFKNLRQSISYGTSVKARGTIDRLLEANGQKIPHKHSIVTGR